MTAISLILSAIVILSLSGFPAVFFSRESLTGQRISVFLFLTGSLAGIAGSVLSFSNALAPSLQLQWSLPWGQFSVAADPLSSFFLLIIFIVPALGSIYSLRYWKQTEHPENGKRLGIFYGLLAGSMALVVISRDAVLFLMAWEIMALSAYFAATAEDHKPEVRQAGWIYLVATHIGTLVLIAMFALWKNVSGSFSLETLQAAPAGVAGTIFILAVIGFGFKAGMMPLHIWLPGAHANAPSHVSAVMSGVMLKMGIYGIVRMCGLFPANEEWWGSVLLAMGALSGIAGIVYAMNQQDIKRFLAYSSIENIGIILMGIGLALLGRAHGRPEWILLGISGALLHVLNHAFFKPLLFFNAGSVLHECRTRDIEKMGGLIRRMPKTGSLFVVGAIAICALPPLNGFISEWLIYTGLFKTLFAENNAGIMIARLAAVALAMIGSLAVAALVKLAGAVFLGSPRSEAASNARDPSFSMRLPMIILALFCLTIGLFPILVVPLLGKAAGSWMRLPDAAAVASVLVPFGQIGVVGLSVLAVAALLFVLFKIRTAKKDSRKYVTWDCGYAAPTPRMQYSGGSFTAGLTKLFSLFLLPKPNGVKIRQYFPLKAQHKTQASDVLLDRIILPFFQFSGKYLPGVRVFQQGQIQLYVLYILAAVLILFSMKAGMKI